MTNPINESVKKLIQNINYIKRLADSNLHSIQLKYDLVFTAHSKLITPILAELDIALEWFKPYDASYEDSIRYYVNELTVLEDELLRIVEDD